jgi:hypothetical protein
MLLTLGMACHEDFHGVAFTVQALRMGNKLEDCEILVVDNAPNTAHGRATLDYLLSTGSKQIRYVPMPEVNSTTQTRERIFREATGEFVLVMDCHVLFPAGTMDHLARWVLENRESRDIISGPLLLNNGGYHTHFNDQWRGGMWGTWATAYVCPCKKTRFTTYQVGETMVCRDLRTSLYALHKCEHCGCLLDPRPWPGHEAALLARGCQPYGWNLPDAPFEIPGQGLGVFGCRREAWPGFNPNFRGFGGEEMYIHGKFRARGDRALCLPWLRWWHRFGRPEGMRYPNRIWDRVRNYVLGAQETGRPTDPIYDHFVSLDTFGESLQDHLIHVHSADADAVRKAKPEELERLHQGFGISEADWKFLMADPVAHVNPPATKPMAAVRFETGRPQPPEEAKSLDDVFSFLCGVKRDLDQHLPVIRSYAGRCGHVTEITKRRESTAALAAARPRVVVSYQREHDILLKRLYELVKAEQDAGRTPHTETFTIHWLDNADELNPIDDTDLLFIDSIQSADRLAGELAAHGPHVRKYLLLRGTGAHGERAEGATNENPALGLFHAIRPWLAANPAWYVAYHTDEEYGITILSCVPEERPAEPVHAWAPGYGPGTELKGLLAQLDIMPGPNCDCNAKARQMDLWGVAGCRLNYDVIVGWMREGAPRWRWQDKLAAAARAVATGIAFKLNPLDPYPGLVTEAIRRAEERQKNGIPPG